MGRFISADDRIVDNGNMFSYCGNNPVTLIDSTGNSFLSKLTSVWKIFKKKIDYVRNYSKINKKKNSLVPTDNDNKYIDNQSELGSYSYGLKKSTYNGCGWIAVYNTNLSMGIQQNRSEAINQLEKVNALSAYGLLGTKSSGIQQYYKNMGYTVKTTFDTNKMDELAKDSMGTILLYWTGSGSHYVSMVKHNEESFRVYNGKQIYTPSIKDYINDNNYISIELITMR